MKLRLDLIGGELALSESEVAENRGHHGAAGVRLDEKRQAVRAGWGAERAHRKGKLTAWERIEALVERYRGLPRWKSGQLGPRLPWQ